MSIVAPIKNRSSTLWEILSLNLIKGHIVLIYNPQYCRLCHAFPNSHIIFVPRVYGDCMMSVVLRDSVGQKPIRFMEGCSTHNGLFLRLPRWHYALKHWHLLFMAKVAHSTECDRVTPTQRREDVKLTMVEARLGQRPETAAASQTRTNADVNSRHTEIKINGSRSHRNTHPYTKT